jgi:hypothetical protein
MVVAAPKAQGKDNQMVKKRQRKRLNMPVIARTEQSPVTNLYAESVLAKFVTGQSEGRSNLKLYKKKETRNV